jgi:hypothetical protein
MALDEGDRLAGAGQAACERRAGLTGADDDRVEGPHHISIMARFLDSAAPFVV